MASFPDIDSQDELRYAYGRGPHAPHLQPGWVEPDYQPAPVARPSELGSSVPSSGDVSTQPLYLPHEFDDSTAPSHNPPSIMRSDGSVSTQSRSYTTTTTGSGSASSLSVPHVRRGAHIDYTSSESGASRGSTGTFNFTIAETTTAGDPAGWTMETHTSTRTAGSTDEHDHQHDAHGGGAANEAAQSEGVLARDNTLESVKSREVAIYHQAGMIGAPPHALTGQEAYMHAMRLQADARLLPPFELPPPFTLGALDQHNDDHQEPPSTRATATAVVRSAASGILTPVSEPRSTVAKPEYPLHLPPVLEEQSSHAAPMTIQEDNHSAEERPAARRLSHPRTPPSTKEEIPETPSPGVQHLSVTTQDPSAELGDPPMSRAAPPQRDTAERSGPIEHRFLPRKGEKAPSPVPPSRESSFGLMSPKTRYLDEAGKRERDGKAKNRAGGRKGKGKTASPQIDEEEVDQKKAGKRKKPASTASGRSKSKRAASPPPSPPSDSHELPPANRENPESAGPETFSTHPSTAISEVVRRSFAPDPSVQSNSIHVSNGVEPDPNRTGTTGTGLGMEITVGSGQRVLVESSSSAPIVEEPEQEDLAAAESSRVEPGSSERRISGSFRSRATRETEWSKDSSNGVPAKAGRSRSRREANSEPSGEGGAVEKEKDVHGTQELASPSQKRSASPPRTRGKRAREVTPDNQTGPSKRRKAAPEPTTPNKAKEAKKVYSVKRNRRDRDVEEREEEAAVDDEGAEAPQAEKPSCRATSKPTSKYGPSEPAVPSKGTKRKADQESSTSAPPESKRPKRGHSEPEPSDRGSVAYKRPRRGQAHKDKEDDDADERATSITTSQTGKRGSARKAAKNIAARPKISDVMEEIRGNVTSHPGTVPTSEVQLDIAVPPTPSPSVKEGAPFSRVFAAWTDKCYYPATVVGRVSSGRKAGQFNLLFDDGCELSVPVESLRAAVLKEGDTVFIQRDNRWRAGRVMEGAFGVVQQDTLVRVRFDEGSQSTEQVVCKLLKVPKNALAEWDDRKLAVEQVTAQVIVKREGEDRRKRSGTAGPAGSVSDSPVNGPSQRRRARVTSSILEGHAFVVTAKEEKAKHELVRLIEANSGEVADDLGDFFEIKDRRIIWKGADRGLVAAWCIAREVSTTPKYLMALALGVPCLGFKFISDVVDGTTTLDRWPPYLLSAGRSDYLGTECSQKVDWHWGVNDPDGRALMDDIISSPHICRPLQNKRILVTISKKDIFLKDRLADAMWAMGAEHVESTTAVDADEDFDSYDFLYWPNEEIKLTIAKEKRAKLVGPNWVKQCLITGLCVPPE